MTVELGEPGVIGVVTVLGLPGVVSGTEHQVPVPGTGQRTVLGLPGPGVTRACSEYTGRSTGDC